LLDVHPGEIPGGAPVSPKSITSDMYGWNANTMPMKTVAQIAHISAASASVGSCLEAGTADLSAVIAGLFWSDVFNAKQNSAGRSWKSGCRRKKITDQALEGQESGTIPHGVLARPDR
jgi:hypothetical protein